jgi:hypothetical protein
MTLGKRIESFSELGQILRDSLEDKSTSYSSDLDNLIKNQQYRNAWFTPENVTLAIKAIADELTIENLTKWASQYPSLNSDVDKMNVGIVMAGNIPLAGFHDFLTVLIVGHSLTAKTSSKDTDLIMFISNILFSINPEFRNRITITDGLIKGFDAVIATGSDNSSRYFEYYFGKYPHIIRKNRNSIAIIDGSESEEELSRLGSDVFSYFGLGCRSVSKIYLPRGYDVARLIVSWVEFNQVINHNKYMNNYVYNKAVFIVNRDEFIDSGYLLFKKSAGISSPVAVLYYDFYESVNNVYAEIEKIRAKIQCIVSRNEIPFGRAQWPHLWDYADGTDTVDFLLKKNEQHIVK